ncbi:MAG: nitrite reductase (NADH) small subunit [Natronomonas sp.]|jgi:nitrite reductase (NADH) small subunit
MSDRVPVKADSTFEPGECELVTVDGQSFGVHNVDSEYYAILNRCAHDCGPVGEGTVRPKLVTEETEPGERERQHYDEDTPTITCPWHGWSYELETGNHISLEDISVPTLDVSVEDGIVYLEP